MIKNELADEMLQGEMEQTTWSENVIVADADYIDQVAFNLTVNFERMIGRRIPLADLARWVECVALDGGVRQREEPQVTTVVLVHEKKMDHLRNFMPANYKDELNGKAFRSPLGEFAIHTVPVEEITNKTNLLTDIIDVLLQQKDVKRIMLVPNAEEGDAYERIRRQLQPISDEKRITLFAMQPMPGGNFHQEILGYSLMQALGISGEELGSES